MLLQDWLQGLRQAPGGLPVALLITPSRLVQGTPGKETPRVEPLLAAWLWTQAAAAMDTPVGVVLVGRDATLRCQPPDGEEARAVLPTLLEGWQAGMDAPLPVALRTALAWVRQERPEQAYEGSFTHAGEVVDPCLARLFEDFEALTADGQFEVWATRLYAPLAAWVAQRVQIELHGSALETPAEEEG